ncbi:MAG: Ig-like domain-containing protein [Firmicutes bacterium]|nr:Ig-like domain-containing protein [Bacillota bacterium]
MRKKSVIFILLTALLLSMAVFAFGCREQETPKPTLTLNTPSLTLFMPDGQEQLTAAVSDDAPDKTVVWTSSNPAVASVDENGVVKAVSAGTGVTITAALKSDPSVSAVCDVRVRVAAESVTLSETLLILDAEGTAQLTAAVVPSNAFSRLVTWNSSNPSTVTVTPVAGTATPTADIRAVGMGTAVITATSTATEDGSPLIAQCTVEIRSYATGLTVDISEMRISNGAAAPINATVLPLGATNSTIVWTTSNEHIATVSQEGVVTARAPGTAEITAALADTENGDISETVAVTVFTPADAMTLSESSIALTIDSDGNTVAALLTASFDGTGAGGLNLNEQVQMWSTTNRDIVDIEILGPNQVSLTANGGGSASVTARSENGLVQTVTVSVTVMVREIVTASLIELYMIGGVPDSITLSAETLPGGSTGATLHGVEWEFVTADGENYITLNPLTGAVTAVAYNRDGVIIRAVALDGGGAYAEVTVRVLAVVEEIVITTVGTGGVGQIELELNAPLSSTVPETVTIGLTINPAEAFPLLTWTSSNESVAIVDADGMVTAVGTGTAVIRVTAQNGVFDEISVSVRAFATEVVFLTSLEEIVLLIENDDRQMFDIAAYALPDGFFGAVNTSLYWRSADPDIASIEFQSGQNFATITAQSEGVTTIYARAAVLDGNTDTGYGAEAGITVRVVTLASGVSITHAETGTLLASSQFETGQNFHRLSLTGMLSNQRFNTRVLPETADQHVTWQSLSPHIASVSEDGLISAVSVGDAVVRVIARDGGYVAWLNISVYAVATGAVLRHEGNLVAGGQVHAAVGRNFTLSLDFEPDGGEIENAQWLFGGLQGTPTTPHLSSFGNHRDIRTFEVLQAGTVELWILIFTANSDGTGLPCFWINVDIVIRDSVTGVEIFDNAGHSGSPISDIILANGSVTQFYAKVHASGAIFNNSVVWSSLHPSVATVNEDGIVRAVINHGTAIIQARTVDGSFIARVRVDVFTAADRIRIHYNNALVNYELNLLPRTQLSYVITPSAAGENAVDWFSLNPAVATVDRTGMVTARTMGTTAIGVRIRNQPDLEHIISVRVGFDAKMGEIRSEVTIGQGKKLGHPSMEINARRMQSYIVVTVSEPSYLYYTFDTSLNTRTDIIAGALAEFGTAQVHSTTALTAGTHYIQFPISNINHTAANFLLVGQDLGHAGALLQGSDNPRVGDVISASWEFFTPGAGVSNWQTLQTALNSGMGFRLTANIDASATATTPYTSAATLIGTVEGDGFIIFNLNIRSNGIGSDLTHSGGGLYLTGGDNALIRNLTLFNPRVDARNDRQVGLLFGRVSGNAVADNVAVVGMTMSGGHEYCGGLAGRAIAGGSFTLRNSYFSTAALGNISTGNARSGGVFGWINTANFILNVINSVIDITLNNGHERVGGIVGETQANSTQVNVINSSVTVRFTGNGARAGALVGAFRGNGGSRLTVSGTDIDVTVAGGSNRGGLIGALGDDGSSGIVDVYNTRITTRWASGSTSYGAITGGGSGTVTLNNCHIHAVSDATGGANSSNYVYVTAGGSSTPSNLADFTNRSQNTEAFAATYSLMDDNGLLTIDVNIIGADLWQSNGSGGLNFLGGYQWYYNFD